MKNVLHPAPAARLLGLGVLVMTMLFSPEAQAQGGRAATSRSDSNVRVERKQVRPQSGKVSERSARTIDRKARATEGARNERKAVKRNSGRKTERVRNERKAVRRDSGRKTEQAGTERKAVRRDSGRKTRQGGAVASNDGSRDRSSREVRRGDVRGTRNTGAVEARRKRIRIERDEHRDGDRRTERARRNRVDDRRKYRSRYTGPRYDGGKSIRHLYDRKDRFFFHKRRHLSRYGWCTAYHHPGHHHYVDAHVHIGSHLYLGFSWPWEVRYHSHWRPRFRYRQVVYVDAGWHGHRRRNRVEVHTYYRHKVLFANDRYSEVEIEIDAVDLYQNGRFLSTVDRIPGSLRKVRAIIHTDGRIEFDRNIFILGDSYTGFEMIATRYYSDHLFSAYEDGHGYKVGRVDLRRGKVKKARRSRLFNRGRFAGHAPISLLPDDDRLWDYGRSLSDRYYDSGPDQGWYRDYRGYEAPEYEGDYELSRDFLDSYSTDDGGEVRLERATVLDRLD